MKKVNANINFMEAINEESLLYPNSRVNQLANDFSNMNKRARKRSELKLSIYDDNDELTKYAIDIAKPMASRKHINLDSYISGLDREAKAIFRYYSCALDGETTDGYKFMNVLDTQYGRQLFTNSNIDYKTIDGKFKYIKLTLVNNEDVIIILYDDIIIAMATNKHIEQAMKSNKTVVCKKGFTNRIYNKFKNDFSNLFIAIYTLETIG